MDKYRVNVSADFFFEIEAKNDTDARNNVLAKLQGYEKDIKMSVNNIGIVKIDSGDEDNDNS